jgi:hypothetical protein
MKRVCNLFGLLTIILTFNLMSAFCQTKAGIFDEKTQITWLGLDFSQTKFIGTASLFAHGAPMTNNEFREVLTVSWNELFINEIKKYDVAKAVHRQAVKYAIDVAEKANSGLTSKEFFSNNPADFKKLTEADIAEVVKNYDFKNNQGIGLIFYVEGMSKGLDKAGMWVTFVDMPSKTVLLTAYETAAPGGFGIRNYWAKPFYIVLKEMGNEYYDQWKHQVK